MGAKSPRDVKWYRRLSQLFAACGSKAGDGAVAKAKLEEMLSVNGLTWNDLPELLAEAKRVMSGEQEPTPHADPAKPGQKPPRDLDIVQQVCGLLDVYLDIKPHERLVVALWVLHCYLHHQFSETPRLMFISPVEGEGKTTALNVLNKMIFPSVKAASFTAPALAATIDRDHPTLLLDEGRNLDLQNNMLMRSIMHSGHERGGGRVILRGGQPTRFETFGPLCITAIEELPSYELMSRAIIIRLRRSTRDDLKKFNEEDTYYDPIYNNIRQWASWAHHNLDLRNANPELPNLKNRRKDNWRPLISIADALGHGDAAREAMSQFDGRYEEAPGVLILRDIKSVFGDSHAMHSKALAEALQKIETSPWFDWKGKDGSYQSHPINPNDIARLLRPFQIRPRSVEIGSVNLKGYHRDDFREAWAAYCPDDDGKPGKPNTVVQFPAKARKQS
jgi:hypothetical protein